MQNLTNLPAGQADKVISGAHLKKSQVREGFYYDIWKNKVMKQMPSAGTTVIKDSTVNIVVSIGNGVAQIPEVLNMPEAEAEQALKLFGFNVKKKSARQPEKANCRDRSATLRPRAGTHRGSASPYRGQLLVELVQQISEARLFHVDIVHLDKPVE